MKSEPHRRKGIRIMGWPHRPGKASAAGDVPGCFTGNPGVSLRHFSHYSGGIRPAAAVLRGGAAGKRFFAALGILAVLRGLFHYGEQYCNHFIAFKLLALIRHKVFAALRRLCPAKLEGKDKGNLISMITTDVELLEVFYAHTISPIAIAAAVP